MNIRDWAYIMAFGASFVGFALGNMAAHFYSNNKYVNPAMDALIYITSFIIGGFIVVTASYGLSTIIGG